LSHDTEDAQQQSGLLGEILQGLSQDRKELPPKLFYDADGSTLFDKITTLAAYYPSKTEASIMRQNVDEMAACIGAEALLIEFGSGVSEKTRILLDHLDDLAGYVPVDISAEHLEAAAESLRAAYPDLEILPLAADFSRQLDIPTPRRKPRKRVLYFAGSSLGNFHPTQARDFLARMRRGAGAEGSVLIGIDMVKDKAVLERAYDDPQGVTRAFNLNMLRRINREFDADFDLSAFEHRACYEEGLQRIEMHLVSQKRQKVKLGASTFDFVEGESILTECSYKWTQESFRALAERAGLRAEKVWADEKGWFNLQYLVPMR